MMENVNIALSESLHEFARTRVTEGGYTDISDHIAALVRADPMRHARDLLEAAVLNGLESGEATPMIDDDWRAIRAEIRHRHESKDA